MNVLQNPPFVSGQILDWSSHARESSTWLIESVGDGPFVCKSISKTPEGYGSGYNVEIDRKYGEKFPCFVVQSDEMFENFDPTMLA